MRTASEIKKFLIRRGMRICKSVNKQDYNNRGGYQLVNGKNIVIEGINFDLSLKDLNTYCDNRKGKKFQSV